MDTAPENIQVDLVTKARKGLGIFVVAVKNFALYPEGSPVRRQSLVNMQNWMADFFKTEDALRLFVDHDRFLFKDEVVYQDKANELPLAAPFFRDGIQRLELDEDLTLEELEVFICLVNKYRVLKEEAEDDLATAMWEAEFVNIKFETANDMFIIGSNSDIASFLVSGDGMSDNNPSQALTKMLAESDGDGQTGTVQPNAAESETHTGTEADQKEADNFWRLSLKEIDQLKTMITEDEKRSSLQDSLDVLLTLIDSIPDNGGEQDILSFWIAEVQYALSCGQFKPIRQFLETLNNIPGAESGAKASLIGLMYKTTSSAQSLAAMAEFWSLTQVFSDDYYGDMRHFLDTLPAESLSSLIQMTAMTNNSSIEGVLLECVARKAARTTVKIALLTNTLNSGQLRKLIEDFKADRSAFPLDILLGLSMHDVETVREAAARAILENNPENYTQLWHLLSDPQPLLRGYFCRQISRRRNPVVEKYLFHYLSDLMLYDKRIPENQLLDCYRVFGLCASADMVSFLAEKLLKKDFKSFFGVDDDGHRLGAAVALYLMPEDWGTAEILEKAASSRFRAVSQACLRAEHEAQQGFGGQHV